MTPVQDFAKLTVEELLDAIGVRTPTPGGGAVTGTAGALACALARMVAAYSVGKKTENAARAKIETASAELRKADKLLRALITQDATAYAAMTEAAKAAKEDATARPAYENAVTAAATVPMEMAAVASNALATMDEFKSVASRYILSDLGIAAVLANATAQAARYTVRVNTRHLSDTDARGQLLDEIARIVEHSAAHLASIETHVRDNM